jgi:poly(3-hydroxybutyrate) depolymerase
MSYPIYQMYQTECDMFAPVQATAAFMTAALAPWTFNPFIPFIRETQAAYELIARSGLRHERPAYNIHSVAINDKTVAVHEEIVAQSPFCTLIHFVKETKNRGPIVLVVAAMSGHFATLTRGTIETLLQDHDVYITDWHSARDMPVSAGKFGLDEYIDHVLEYLELLGPKTNVMAICQSGPPVLAAVSILAQRNSHNQPASITLMASPIDPRQSPNKINKLAESKKIDFFQQFIQTVPFGPKGSGRRVYPGFLQITAFMSMNLQSHVNKHIELYNALVHKDVTTATTITDFYDEYRAVCDATEEFYLDTIQRVFLDYDLAKGTFYHHGLLVTPSAIKQTRLLCVEGENDDMCGIGQTHAAATLCTGLKASQKQYYVQKSVGHYGVFNGRRWTSGIYPVVKASIAGKRLSIISSTSNLTLLKTAA